jgi:DNA mismatch repair protein MutS
VHRARTVLERLEAADRAGKGKPMIDDLPLFSAAPPAAPPQKADPLRVKLDKASPD